MSSFQALVVFLREKSIIAVTQRCFRRLYMICVYRHGTPPLALMPKHVNVRVILCAYMIAHCPSEVFESIGATEKALIDSAIAFVDNFQSLAKKAVEVGAVSLIPIDFTRNFPTLIFEYLKCYKAWKIPDAAKLKCRIKHALVALLQAQRHLPFNEPHESKLSVELRTQIERLRSKLQLVAGVEALNEFDETCRINRMSDPPAVQAYVSVPTRMSNEQLTHEVLLDPAFQIDNRGNVDIEGQLYHEIIDYFMQVCSSVYDFHYIILSDIKFLQAFWDSLVDDLLLPFPCYTRVLRVLVEIRDGIKGIAGGCESIAICEAIDISFIEQQLRLNAFGWDCCQRLVGTVVGIIQKVQLPSRDAETKALWATQQESMVCAEVDQPRVLCQAIRFLMDLLNNLRIDSANARYVLSWSCICLLYLIFVLFPSIRRLSLVVKDHGIDNERRLFQVKLDSGAIVLTNTKEWICNAVRFEIAAGEDLASGSPQSFIAVHIAAMISIVTNPTPIQSETIPETLLLDMNRIRGMQNKFQSIVDGATAFVTATHSLSDKSIEKKQVLVSLGGFIASNETFDLGLVLVELGQKLDSAGILTDQAARCHSSSLF